ncbi:FAD-dependent oxidoreductase [Klebsiella michiganensis]|nr:FAD-dependent oxidoreductase [Klebsiella michiganensis]
MAEQQFDVAVIGLGALGAATLWRLAEQGVKAIGIDQFTPPHDLGATHGKTRLFRTFCLEHPVLGDYARLSRRLFQSLEQSSGGSLLSITGGTIIVPPGLTGGERHFTGSTAPWSAIAGVVVHGAGSPSAAAYWVTV